MAEKKMHAVIESYYWECGDGCCSDSGYDISLEMDGQTVATFQHYDCDTVLAENVAQALGCELTYEYK